MIERRALALLCALTVGCSDSDGRPTDGDASFASLNKWVESSDVILVGRVETVLGPAGVPTAAWPAAYAAYGIVPASSEQPKTRYRIQVEDLLKDADGVVGNDRSDGHHPEEFIERVRDTVKSGGRQ